MDLDRVKAEAERLGPWTYLAPIGADGDPDVVPVHPAWDGDVIWFMASTRSTKVRNIAHHPSVAMHWQASEAGEGLEVWGTAEVHADLDTKRRLWNAFDYDLNLFAPGGPEGSPEVVFVAIRPTRALAVSGFGSGKPERWAA